MDEQLDDFADRIFALISKRDKPKTIRIEFVGFANQDEMKLFQDFIAVTLGINQFKEDHIIDRANITIH
tara:strand:+ start:997 stop:1203 length:207 start_codon:yes stop_codon:yes gene_type:complete